jgi:hypothetical protein
MKPNIDICKKCALENYLKWYELGVRNNKIMPKKKTPEEFCQWINRSLKKYGLMWWCCSMFSDNIGVYDSMNPKLNFDENNKTAPRSKHCPYFTEQVIINEA